MPKREISGLVWIPKVLDIVYDIYITIDGIETNITSDVISSEFTHAIVGLETQCKLELIDADGYYGDKIKGGEIIKLKLDSGVTIATTVLWAGIVERPKKKFGQSVTLEILGSHYQNTLLDITVTEEFDGSTSDDSILSGLITEYLTGYTDTNVGSSTNNSFIKWNNKPFFDCAVDICNNSGFDCYVDSDKDVHFFERESILNENEAIVWDDTLLSIDSFGTDDVDIKNRVIVYGENGGFPVIYQVDDATSQGVVGVKEKIVKDSNIKTYAEAKLLGDTLLAQEKDRVNQGEFSCLIMPMIRPGDMIWIVNPIQKIHDKYRIVKYTHLLPDFQTKVVISREKSIPLLFKARQLSDMAKENLLNKYRMEYSFNFSFDDASDIDSALSSGVVVSEGYLTISAAAGTMISNNRSTVSDVTYVYVDLVGEGLTTCTAYVSTDNRSSWQQISLRTETLITTPGSNISLKLETSDAVLRIDSAVILYR